MRHPLSLSFLPLCLLVLTALGCKSPMMRVRVPDTASGPPVVERLTDLGGLPLPELGEIAPIHSDSTLTPGEWIAVRGKNLDASSELLIDGNKVPVAGHLKGGSLLMRLPRGLSPRADHKLEIKTTQGACSRPFTVKSYIVVGDTDAKNIRFVPLSRETELVLEHDALEMEVKEGYFHALSADGSLLFVLQRSKAGEANDEDQWSPISKIAVVHMGAAQGPKPIGTFTVSTPSSPTALVILDDRTLALLGERDLTLLDVSIPEQGRVLSTLALPLPAAEPGKPLAVQYDDLVMVKGRRSAAVLELYGNSLTLINLEDLRAPRVEATLPLLPAGSKPYSIDLAVDPEDPRSLWVLQGANFRIAQTYFSNAIGKTYAKLERLFGAKTEPPVPALTREQEQAEMKKAPSRLLRVVLEDGTLRVAEERPLPPNFFPFFVFPKRGDQQLVSGVNGHVLRFGKVPLSMDGVKQIAGVLADSTQFGRIIAIKKDQPPENVLQGISLFFGLGTLHDGTLVYSLLRPTTQILPPFLTVAWGVEAGDQGFVPVTSLGYRSLIPPYSLSLFEVQ